MILNPFRIYRYRKAVQRRRERRERIRAYNLSAMVNAVRFGETVVAMLEREQKLLREVSKIMKGGVL